MVDEDKGNANYKPENCQSLFGYAKEVHERSGGICQLCGCGSGDFVDFDLWRQMTVEHLIGKSQGGYFKDIHEAVKSFFQKVFPDLAHEKLERIAKTIDDANTVTACSFCNSTTSRIQNEKPMKEMFESTTGSIDERLEQIRIELERVLLIKRRKVQDKLRVIRVAFEENVKPELQRKRNKGN